MAEDQSLTPEQQLLKLIEEQNKAGAKAQPVSSRSAAAPRKPAKFSLSNFAGAATGMFSFWKRKAKKKSYTKKASFGLAEANKVLVVAVALLLVYVVFDAVASARNLQRPPNFVPPKDLRSTAKVDAVQPLEETSYYLQKISSRDIFKEGRKEEVVVETAPAKPVEEAAEAVQNLALVGISWSSNPDAIIEDKSSQRTYFVKRGQMAGEAVKVEAIFKDHVVVTFEDKEYELR